MRRVSSHPGVPLLLLTILFTAVSLSRAFLSHDSDGESDGLQTQTRSDHFRLTQTGQSEYSKQTDSQIEKVVDDVPHRGHSMLISEKTNLLIPEEKLNRSIDEDEKISNASLNGKVYVGQVKTKKEALKHMVETLDKRTLSKRANTKTSQELNTNITPKQNLQFISSLGSLKRVDNAIDPSVGLNSLLFGIGQESSSYQKDINHLKTFSQLTTQKTNHISFLRARKDTFAKTISTLDSPMMKRALANFLESKKDLSVKLLRKYNNSYSAEGGMKQGNAFPSELFYLPVLPSRMFFLQQNKRGGNNLWKLSPGIVPDLSKNVIKKNIQLPVMETSRNLHKRRRYDVPQIECPPSTDGTDRFACPSADRKGRYRCIDDRGICDGFIDCPNGEDEDRMSCMFYKTTKAHLDVLADALLRWARGRY